MFYLVQLINIILNLFLIPLYKHNGSAISTLCAETMVTISLVYMSKKLINFKLVYKNCINYFIASTIMLFALLSMPPISANELINLLYIKMSNVD